MKTIKIHNLTWFFLLLSFLCGYIKTILIIYFIVIFHELGHVFFIKIFGFKINKITLYPFGGLTTIKKAIHTPFYQDFLIALGGILFQCILFLLLVTNLSITTKEIVLKYNISILLFNLIPIIPLDGSKLMDCILNKLFPYQISYQISILFSLISILLYIFINYWYALNNYLMVTFFVFKTIEAIKYRKYMYHQFLLERHLHQYNFSKISTKTGDLSILKKDTYQYFKEKNKVISEKKKLMQMFDKSS